MKRVEKILFEFNDKLMGAPSGVIVYLCCVATAYALHLWRFFRNNTIPIATIGWGIFLFLLVCPDPTPDVSFRNWIGRNICLGIIISTAAWMTHRSVIKRFGKKLGIIDDHHFDSDRFERKPKDQERPCK
jgi:hypothetical protein